jgi:hypothetical protein
MNILQNRPRSNSMKIFILAARYPPGGGYPTEAPSLSNESSDEWRGESDPGKPKARLAPEFGNQPSELCNYVATIGVRSKGTAKGASGYFYWRCSSTALQYRLPKKRESCFRSRGVERTMLVVGLPYGSSFSIRSSSCATEERSIFRRKASPPVR